MATTTKKVSVTGTTTSAAPLLSKDVLGKAVPSIAWTESSKAGSNVFNVDAGTKTATLALRGTSGDVVKINGYSGDYAATLSGLKLTLHSETQTVIIALAKTSKVTLGFIDGDKTVDATAKLLGDQSLLLAGALPIHGQNSHEATQLAGTTFHSVADLLAAYNVFASPTFSVVTGGGAAEGTSASFTINLSAAQSIPTSVNVALTPLAGSTTTSADYSSNGSITTGASVANNILTFAPGVTTATIKFPILTDAISPETGEGVTLTLTSNASSVAKINAAASSGTVNFIDVPYAAMNTTLAANGNVTASNIADTFKLAVPSSSYETTIVGFDYAADKILVPTGSNKPSAISGGVNDGADDGKVDLTWTNNGQLVTIHLTGLSVNTENALEANAVSSVFGTY